MTAAALDQRHVPPLGALQQINVDTMESLVGYDLAVKFLEVDEVGVLLFPMPTSAARSFFSPLTACIGARATCV